MDFGNRNPKKGASLEKNANRKDLEGFLLSQPHGTAPAVFEVFAFWRESRADEAGRLRSILLGLVFWAVTLVFSFSLVDKVFKRPDGAIIAYVSELIAPIGIFLSLIRQNLMTQSLRYLFLGEGETGLMVYKVLLAYWEWTPEEDVRPLIFLMSD